MKKRRLSFLFAMAVVLTVVGNCLLVPTNAETKTVKPTYEQGWSEVIDSAVEGKDYSKKGDEYLVFTNTGLAYVLSAVSDINDETVETVITLENDIDFSERYWDCPANFFNNVTFDGNNKTITGLVFDIECNSFLSHIANNSVFENINIELDVQRDDVLYLFAYSSSSDSLTVKNCSVKGNITFDYCNDENQGCAILFGAISAKDITIDTLTLDVNVDCSNMKISTQTGLITQLIYGENINFENITIKGSIQFENADEREATWDEFGCIAGRIVAKNGDSIINMKNCNVYSNITFKGNTEWYYFGGLVGHIECGGSWQEPSADVYVEDCSYSGNIVAECERITAIHFGGMFGNVYHMGNVVVKGGSLNGMIKVDVSEEDDFNDAIAGFAGNLSCESLTMNDFESDMDIIINSQVVMEDISDQYQSGHLYTVGGIIGYLDADESFTFEDCKFAGDISVTNQGLYYLSGVVGNSYSSKDSGFKNVSYTGDIKIDHVGDINYIAGILSYAYQSSNTLYMIGCDYIGDITLTNGCDNIEDLAGLLGKTYTNVNMVDCSHVGDIIVDGCAFNETCGYVGGLASRLFDGNEINLEHSYSEGDIILTNDKNVHMVGGIIAYVQGNVNISSDIETYTDISAEKKWIGFSDTPNSIKVQLYVGEQAIGEVIELSENNNWKYTWNNLPLPLKQAKEDSEDKLSYHKGDIIIEDSTCYRYDGLWVGGIVGNQEGGLDLINYYHIGNILVKNCDGRNKEMHVGGWYGGCGNTNYYDSQVTSTSATTNNKNSYCVADVTVEDCYNVSTLYVGGIIGSSNKENTQDNFENFFYQGTVTVKHEGNKYFGSLFGYLSQIGEFTNFNYDVKTISNEEKEIGFCGNIDFDESVLKHFVENDKISQIITAESYSVKEQEIDNCSVSYDRDGNNIVITNTYKSNVPATGDNFYLYITIMMVSLVGLAYVSFKKKQID